MPERLDVARNVMRAAAGLEADEAAWQIGKRPTSWLRDTLMRITMAPRLSRSTRWKAFLPMSRPIVATGSDDF